MMDPKTLKHSNAVHTDVIGRMAVWYKTHCDGIWEHDERIRIQTLDNPGWKITVNLKGTECEDKPFQLIEEDREEVDGVWYACFLRDGRFVGAGDPRRLPFLIETFLAFAQSNADEADRCVSIARREPTMPSEGLIGLSEWYAAQCVGRWEHAYGVEIHTLDNPGWFLEVDLVDTALEGRELAPENVEITDDDWFHCHTEKGQFIAAGDPTKLAFLINKFLAFAASGLH